MSFCKSALLLVLSVVLTEAVPMPQLDLGNTLGGLGLGSLAGGGLNVGPLRGDFNLGFGGNQPPFLGGNQFGGFRKRNQFNGFGNQFGRNQFGPQFPQPAPNAVNPFGNAGSLFGPAQSLYGGGNAAAPRNNAFGGFGGNPFGAFSGGNSFGERSNFGRFGGNSNGRGFLG